MRCCHSSGVSLPRPRPLLRPHPHPQPCPQFCPKGEGHGKTLISDSSSEISLMRGFCCWKPLVGLAKVHQFLLNSLAFSTNPANVVGIGDSWSNLLWRAVSKALRNAYILVASSTLALLAYLLHSWYQSPNSRFLCGVLCIFWIASFCISGGMNCSLKAVLKSCHVP